jgi:hypothetical protein
MIIEVLSGSRGTIIPASAMALFWFVGAFAASFAFCCFLKLVNDHIIIHHCSFFSPFAFSFHACPFYQGILLLVLVLLLAPSSFLFVVVFYWVFVMIISYLYLFEVMLVVFFCGVYGTGTLSFVDTFLLCHC